MSMDEVEARIQKTSAPWMAVIGFALLGAVALAVAVPAIERELGTRSAVVLQGFDWVAVEIDGRTLSLTGIAPDQSAHLNMQRAARRISDFVRIHDQTTIGKETNPKVLEQAALATDATLQADAVTEDPQAVVAPVPIPSDTPGSTDASDVQQSAPVPPREGGVAPEPEPHLEQGREPEKDLEKEPQVELPAVADVIQPPPPVSTVPLSPSATCQGRLDSAMRDEIIRFQSASTEVLPGSYPLLQDIARVTNSCNERVEVAGHTDDLGEADENKVLSLRRAQAVVDYLVSQGVSAEMLTPMGYGEEIPAQPNTTWAGRKANRRIEFKSLPSENILPQPVAQESP